MNAPLDTPSEPARQTFENLQVENARLQQVVADKNKIIDDKEKIIGDKERMIIDTEKRVRLLEEQLRLLSFKLFGAKSEKLSADQIQLLLEEISVLAGEVAQEALRPEPEKQITRPSRKVRAVHPGRDPLPEHLERREEIIPCHPKDCRCDQCGGERPVIGYETREELACEPAVFYVRVIKREKRGSHCLEEQGVATAPAPAQIVPKSKFSNEFIIEALAKKYQEHLPIYRQCAILEENFDLELNRKTLGNGVLAAGALLQPVVQAQAVEIKTGGYIQVDETPVPCQSPEKAGRHHRAYLWEYGQPGGLVVFDFQMSRGREGPAKFLQGFRGQLQSDGYAAYDKLGEGITYVGCMAHARRGFVDALKVAPQNPLPAEVIKRIGELYAVEAQAREAGMNATNRLALRQDKSAPVMATLKGRLVEIRMQIPPGGKLAQACDYALNQWGRLEEYLKDGRLEIDNNWCEGGMRPLALGRKNWLSIGSAEAGPKVAAIASIVETCRRLDINLREYLKDVLPKLAADWPITRVAELTPSRWKINQQKA